MVASKDNESLSISELFAASLQGEYEDEAPWEAVRALRRRGTTDVFELASKHCQSDDPRARARALDVLGQLGTGKPDLERPYFQDCVTLALDHVGDDDPLVVNSAAWALAHLQTERCVPALIGLMHHTDPDVRLAVAFGMHGSTRSEATCTYIELMNDADDEVRDWATFGLGSISNEDSSQIREALHQRLNDTYDDARMEAIWGLARRKDVVGLRMLLERLESESWTNGDEMAAEETLDVTGDTPVESLRNGLRKLLEDYAGDDRKTGVIHD